MSTNNKFEFKSLPYANDALEPYIDKQTLEIHHDKHHKTYYENFIKGIKDTEMESMSIKDIFRNISKYPKLIRNNGGGFYNHTFYWEGMKRSGSELKDAKFSEAIDFAFKSFEEFKIKFIEAGKARFGCGWVWLCLNEQSELFICSTPNQDNPIMDIAKQKGIPLLAMDLWEHAYYLKYQNKRTDYMEGFWKVINWEEISKRYAKAVKKIGAKWLFYKGD